MARMMKGWTEGSVHTNGIEMHYYRTGGKGPVIVAAHGITDNGQCWSRLASKLADRYDFVLADARGHGLSDKPASAYSPQDHAQDLAGLISSLDIAPRGAAAGVLGHSMGAASVAVLAATFPELVTCLVLEDPPWRDVNVAMENRQREQWVADFRQRLAADKKMSQKEIAEEGRRANPTWSEEEFEAWSAAKLQVSEDVVESRASSRVPWQSIVPELQCPTLLVTGDPDLGGIVSPDVAAQIAQMNPNIRVAHIADAGHNIRREQFERYVQALSTFFAAHLEQEGTEETE